MNHSEMTLEAQLGNALGLAIMFLRTGDWSNRDMTRLEVPFKAWCDKVASELNSEPQPEPPTAMEIIALADEIEAAGLGQVDLVRAALARWGS